MSKQIHIHKFIIHKSIYFQNNNSGIKNPNNLKNIFIINRNVVTKNIY